MSAGISSTDHPAGDAAPYSAPDQQSFLQTLLFLGSHVPWDIDFSCRQSRVACHGAPLERKSCQKGKSTVRAFRYLLRPEEDVGLSGSIPGACERSGRSRPSAAGMSTKTAGTHMDEMLTLKETRDILKVSRNTMYMLVRDGVIPARKVGSEWRIMRSTLVEWMKQREN